MAIRSELVSQFKFDNAEPLAPSDMLGYITCNEAVTPDFLKKLTEKRGQKPGGVGLAIGSGGTFSLLPFLGLDGMILVDINPAVLGFTQFVGDCISQAQSPEHAKEIILNDLPPELHELDPESYLHISPSISTIAALKLQREARLFGDIHWSNPEAFPRVQEAIAATNVTYANRSIVSSYFYSELNTVLGQTEQPLTYVNFSNVHHWLSSTRPFATLERIADPDAAIQYSVHPTKATSPNLEARIADSFPHYLDLTTREIRALGKKSAKGRSMPMRSFQP